MASELRKARETSTIAVRMAQNQREISISEFFAKNRHLLGFDNPKKALLTTIKEAVDNSLDACEEAGILPEISIRIEAIPDRAEQFRVTVEDNGPGILKVQLPKIFGKLLYGSKFHRLKMSRGQQGIGISAAGLYGQLTTGRSVEIISKVANARKANRIELKLDTATNKPVVLSEEEIDWERASGTSVAIVLEAKYQKGRQSVDDFIRQCLISNPHATFHFFGPENPTTPAGQSPAANGSTGHGPIDEALHFEREVKELPPEAKEIKPHPYGVELGVLIKMAGQTRAKATRAFLVNDFSRVSPKIADEILTAAGLAQNQSMSRLAEADIERIYEAIKKVKIMAPPTNCVVPMGEEAIVKGLKREIEADFYAATTRSPAVYRGNPFVIEAGIAYGGKMPLEEPVTLLRFANRVPLLYQQFACVIHKAVVRNDWRKYGLNHPKGALPIGPMTILIHMASVWVPFTSESKEAIADYPEIRNEIRLAIQECGRKLGFFISKRERSMESERKASYIDKYIPHIGLALKEMLKLNDKQEQHCLGKLRTLLERSRVE